MRMAFTAAAFSIAATASWATPPVVTENLTGTISGSQTVDTNGYFGKAGANLSGATVAIYVQYEPKLLGANQTCRTHGCTYNVSVKMPDTPGSLLITITINGHRVVYSPSYEGAIFFSTSAPYQLTIDADAFSGFGLGLPGFQFSGLFTSVPVFGQPLSPGHGPVLKASPNDYLDFFEANSQTPVEQLTYTLTGGTR